MTSWIDSDQHLYEYRGLWAEHIDPARRDDAIRFEDDPLGHVRVKWRDRVLAVADVQVPGETDAIGERRRREREGLPPLITVRHFRKWAIFPKHPEGHGISNERSYIRYRQQSRS